MHTCREHAAAALYARRTQVGARNARLRSRLLRTLTTLDRVRWRRRASLHPFRDFFESENAATACALGKTVAEGFAAKSIH